MPTSTPLDELPLDAPDTRLVDSGVRCVPERGTAADQKPGGPGIAQRMLAVCHWLSGGTARRYAMSLGDQLLVSGSRFLVTVIIGRVAGAEQLGLYALGFTVVMLLGGTQHSLISGPYSVYAQRLGAAALRRYSGSVLLHWLALNAITVPVLFAAGLASQTLGGSDLALLLWVLAPLMPLLLWRELVRQMAFARLTLRAAFLLDLLASGVQFAGLLLLWRFDALSAATAYAVIALGCALAGAWWLLDAWHSLAFSRRQLMPSLLRNWRLGCWDYAAEMMLCAQAYAVYWLLAWMAGAEATGVYAACITLLMFANPLILGINNIFVPHASRAFAAGGRHRMHAVVVRLTAATSAVMALVCLLAVWRGNWLLERLYGSSVQGDHWALVSILSASALTAVVSGGLEIGLWVAERPVATFRASLVGAVVTLAAALPLIGLQGVAGAAWAILIGRLITLPMLALSYKRVVVD